MNAIESPIHPPLELP